MMMMYCLLLPLLPLLLFSSVPSVVLVTASSSSSSSSSSLQLHPDRPPFVSHITDQDLRDALQVVKTRHEKAVQLALTNFPTDDNEDDDSATISTNDFLDRIQLDEYVIDAPGSLPDFDTELEKRIYVTCRQTPLLSKEECASVIQMAEQHFAATNNGVWTTKESGDYNIAGFMIKDIPTVKQWFIRTVKTKLFPLLQKQFPEFCDTGDSSNDNVLCVDNAYLFKYTPETGRRSDIHTDSGCLSFTIALNPKSDYTGGGTWFEGLKKVHNNDNDSNDSNSKNVIEMDVGQVTIRPGGVKHCGHAIESGQRYIIGGFCMHKYKPEPVRMLLTPSTPTTIDHGDDDMLTIANLEAALAINPYCDSTYNLLANMYKQQQLDDSDGDDVQKSQQVLEYCLERIHPKSGGIAYPLGSMYLNANNLEKAIQCFELCLEADPSDADAMTSLGQIYNALGDRVKEEYYYNRIINTLSASSKSIGGAYCNLGILKEQEGKPDEEIQCYVKALEYQPNSFVSMYSLGCAYAGREQWMDATTTFKRAVELLAGDDDDEDNNTMKALQSLYKSATYQIRSSSKEDMPASQQDMMAKLHELMGVENFKRLQASLASSGKKQQ